MSDGMINDLDFEKRISELDDRGLLEFTARQVFGVRKTVTSNTSRIISLESKSKKILAITGGIGSILGAAVVSVINHFASK